ncbi:hypothetical protein, partial [Microbacterium lacticum]|uniref:hypothetical protein n=1 Tax=Microbacterium lacticum TaxID=33885 RepID=UPI001E2E2C1D
SQIGEPVSDVLDAVGHEHRVPPRRGEQLDYCRQRGSDAGTVGIIGVVFAVGFGADGEGGG